MQEKIKDALEGKVTIEELNEEEKVAFYQEVKNASQDELKKLSAFRSAKRDEEQKVKDAQSRLTQAEEELSKLQTSIEQTKKEQTQFRTEQIGKAKERFFSQFKVDDEKKKAIEETFARLDSGKIDVDLIVKDFVASYAAVDPESYLTATKKAEEMRRNADAANAGQAGSNNTPPAGSEPPKYDDRTKKVAQEAGVSEEQADKVLREGLSRTY
jgi:TolA-binding protein